MGSDNQKFTVHIACLSLWQKTIVLHCPLCLEKQQSGVFGLWTLSICCLSTYAFFNLNRAVWRIKGWLLLKKLCETLSRLFHSCNSGEVTCLFICCKLHRLTSLFFQVENLGWVSATKTDHAYFNYSFLSFSPLYWSLTIKRAKPPKPN